MREIPASQLREGILRMLSDKSKLRTLLLSDDLDIRHKLQNILITISMAGCAASVVISFATQMSLAGNLASLLGLLTLSLAFYLSVIRKKKEAASYLITIAVNLVLFPLMYMLNGGVYSGMPLSPRSAALQSRCSSRNLSCSPRATSQKWQCLT